jgi:hypothetical protein
MDFFQAKYICQYYFYMKLLLRNLLLFAFLTTASQSLKAQFLMDMIDTTKEVGKGLLSIYKKYDRIRIGGYMQPQFQWAQSKGAKTTYSGGDFSAQSNNRFMLRRGRIRFEYVHFSDDKKPSEQFVFQFDGTERGVFIRDFYGRIYENNLKLFSLATGMFARPFGYEVNLSSSDRESPERGRMSQTLMKVERDIGAMISLEPRDRKNLWQYFKWDAGLFNGQGLTAPGEYDSYKDFISRIGWKPYPVTKNLLLSAGVSYLHGGLVQNNKFTYTLQSNGLQKMFVLDSSLGNIGNEMPRRYHGADVQLKWLHRKGATEVRAEYWAGTQTGSQSTSETPSTLFTVDSYYVRKFNGAFFIFFIHLMHVIKFFASTIGMTPILKFQKKRSAQMQTRTRRISATILSDSVISITLMIT